jgi:hypothetical protein
MEVHGDAAQSAMNLLNECDDILRPLLSEL